MKAAKHRIESIIRPLSRIVLDPGAFLSFAVRLYVERRDECAGIFLVVIEDKMFILLALMADAGCEASVLIRQVEGESADSSQLIATCSTFLTHITWMFLDRGVLTISSHTAFVIEWLKVPHTFQVSGVARTIGGKEYTSEDLDDCFNHMEAYCVLAREVVRAEFPEWDFISSLSCFNVSAQVMPTRLHNLKGGGRRTARQADIKQTSNEIFHLGLAPACIFWGAAACPC